MNKQFITGLLEEVGEYSIQGFPFHSENERLTSASMVAAKLFCKLYPGGGGVPVDAVYVYCDIHQRRIEGIVVEDLESSDRLPYIRLTRKDVVLHNFNGHDNPEGIKDVVDYLELLLAKE